MGKTRAGIIDSYIFEDVSDNGGIINGLLDLSCESPVKTKNLSSCVKYINEFSLSNLVINDELANKKVYELTKKLANAVDRNAVLEVKRIKHLYGNTDEYAKAKDFLNKQCKIVWDVFENKHSKMKIPQQAMRVLGITNKPSLEYLLNDSLMFYERDNGSTTVDIIKSILSNPNMDYSFDDIFYYLRKISIKYQCKFNLITLLYIAKRVDYNEKRLSLLGISKAHMAVIFVSLPFKEKLKFLFRQLPFKSL